MSKFPLDLAAEAAELRFELKAWADKWDYDTSTRDVRIKELEAEVASLRGRVARLMKIEDRYRLTPEGHEFLGPSE